MAFARPIRRAWNRTKNFVKKRLTGYPTEQVILNTDNIAKVLIIGETGSGKSTFINYLTNYFNGGDLENLRVAIPSQFHPEPTEEFEWNERSVADNTQSQTDACHQYIFVERQTNEQYLFLDSPGLGDTRGIDQDNINMDKIIEAVERLGDLTAVIIVVNGSVCREHLVIRNVVARLQGYLPYAVLKRVIVVLTNAKRHEATFDLKLLHLHGTVYPYYMQNAAFCSDPDEWDESIMKALQTDWDQSMEELAAIINTINSFQANSVKEFTKMKEIRNRIKTLMHAACLQVTEIQRMQDEIAMFEAGLKQAKEGTVAFSNYSTHRIVDKIEIVEAPYHSTLCQNCNHVCHDRCNLDETSIAGAQLFKRCTAMDDSGACKECPHKCSYTDHYHAKATVKHTQQTLEDVIADIKAKYDKASDDKSTYEHEIKTKSDAKSLLEKALVQKNEDIKRYCLELKNICPGFNLASELSAFIDQLRVQASLLRDTTAREQANQFIRSLELFCDSIESNQGSTKTFLPEMVVMPTRRTHQTKFYSVQSDVQPIPVSSASKTSHVDQSVMNLIKQLNLSSNNNGASRTTKQISATNITDLHQEETTQKPMHPKVIHPTAEDLMRLTNKELIVQYEDEKTDQRTSKMILAELTRRSQGKSTGPVFAASDIILLNEYTQKYREFNITALTFALYNLQNQVNEIIDNNIVRLAEVGSALLLEMCAVHSLLLRNSNKDKHMPGVESPDKTTKLPEPSSVSNPINSEVNTATSNDATPGYVYVPVMGGPDRRHIVEYVLVQSETLPSTRSGSVPRATHKTNYHRAATKEKSKTSRIPLRIKSTDVTQIHQQRANEHHDHGQSSPPHVTLTDCESDSEQLDVDDTSSIASNSSTSATASKTTLTLASGTIIPPVFVGDNNNSDDLRCCSDARLLKDYDMLAASCNRIQQHAIYNELERRCYGDHPLLIVQEKNLFDSILNIHRSKPIEELTKLHQNVRKAIDLFLGNAGPTNIHILPHRHIIEAAVLAKLLAEKS